MSDDSQSIKSSVSASVPPSPTVVGDEEDQKYLEKSPRLELDHDPFLVAWDEHDPGHPMNWSPLKKWWLTALGALLILDATFSSAAASGLMDAITDDLGMSHQMGVLVLSLFIGGYCVGPMIWAPLSETYGRRPMFIISFAGLFLWQVACGLAPNSTCLLVFRFLAGCFAANPMTNVGAVSADLWDARQRGSALAVSILAPFAGPVLGPTVSGYLAKYDVNWRWIFWILASVTLVCLLLIVFTSPETYSPILLKRKAKAKRVETKDDRYYAPIERTKLTIKDILVRVIGRPAKMMLTEPMLSATTVYISFNYGCLYLLIEAYPVIFTQGHNLDEATSGLVFIPLFLGGSIATILFLVFFEPHYLRKMKEAFPNPVAPEYRLYMAMLGAPIYVVSFFWMGWTSFPSISFWVPMSSGLAAGCAILLIFSGLTNYQIDVYTDVTASALATQTIMRSLFGVAFPLFTPAMFVQLTPRWACTILGGVASLCAFIPFVLYRYGPYLRSRSRYQGCTTW